VLRLARELAALQRQRLVEAEQWISRERRHVDSLSLIHAAGGQAGQARAERSELEDLRHRLQALASAANGDPAAAAAAGGDNAGPSSSSDAGAPTAAAAGQHIAIGGGGIGVASEDAAAAAEVREELAGELRRLRGERAELLDTGVYREGDPIIAEISAQIEAIELNLGAAVAV
jgi:hypothetical protein